MVTSDRLRALRLDLNRRQLLRGFGAAAVTMMGASLAAPALAQPVFALYPFQLGVASGDPAPDGFVIWTRLAPEPFEMGYGMPQAAVPVEWEVASDAGMRTVVQRGTTFARPELGHSVHVEVGGLEPGRPYWYRFLAGRERSAIARARTTPALGAKLDRVRFAVAGCQHYEHGYYTAHRALAEQEPDFVYCYGDYIYEYRSEPFYNATTGRMATVRQHFGGEIQTIADYRRRYAQYKMDADLQAAHAAAPWFTVWDDHEIDNNWVSDIDQDGTPPEFFRLRQQMAMQAYYENMPLRASSLPVGHRMQIYRQARYGDLLDLNLLDTRQYRTDQPCGDVWGTTCPEISRADAEVLGRTQEKWLADRLKASQTTWQVLAQQVVLMDLDRQPGAGEFQNVDSWAGYRVPRQRVLETIRDLDIGGAVVLTGDEHIHYAGELHLDGKNPGKTPIATEFVCTSITSGSDGMAVSPAAAAVQAENPQLKWHNNQRGFLVCDVTHERWLSQPMVVDKVSERGGTVSPAKAWAVEPGRPGLVEA